MVAVMVHVAPLDAGGARCMRLLQCEQDTTVAELKAMARSAPHPGRLSRL
jgi:hypothetical protein